MELEIKTSPDVFLFAHVRVDSRCKIRFYTAEISDSLNVLINPLINHLFNLSNV